jgi:hypothetical protein
MSDIYALSPVNKTASIVTSQSNCASDNTLSDEQKRENLVTKLKALEIELLSHPKGSKRRKLLGLQKIKLTKQVNSIRPKRKCKGVEAHVLDILKEELTDFQFKRILHLASVRSRQST